MLRKRNMSTTKIKCFKKEHLVFPDETLRTGGVKQQVFQYPTVLSDWLIKRNEGQA